MQDPGDPVGRRVPAELEGVDRTAARERVVALLRQQGLLEKIEPHHHAVRRCYRCGTLVEPRLSDQWFVKMQPLAQRALREFRRGRLSFVPERWGGVYENWLTQIRDWNISRQIWFGHRIPAWYCPDGHITVSQTDPTACGTCGQPVRQDDDVLDTWFSSGLWPFATLGWPRQTEDLKRFYPGSTLVTGPDIIFFWVARMVMLGYHFLDERPFETVVFTGIVRDAQHRKMSKSAGNGIDPLEVIQRFGADALRFTVVAAAPLGTDILLDPKDLETSFAPGRNFANKLWNAGRLILPHLGGKAGRREGGKNGGETPDSLTALPPYRHTALPPSRLPAPAQLELADRWILSRTQRAVAATTEALERFRLSDAANAAYHFVWDEVADWYLEQVKPRLYGQAPGGDTAREVLGYVFETALRLLHPVMPFITEQLWGHLPEAREPLLAAAAWPTARAELLDPLAEERFGRVQALVTAVRSVRAEYGVHPSRTVRAVVQAASPAAGEAFRAERQTIERLAKLASLTLDGQAAGTATAEEPGAHAVLADGSSVFVPLADAIDVRKECERLGRERERLDRQLEAQAAKLANPQFIGRAPADVVERERTKERSWREQRDALAAKLSSLGC
jgi:valyl-tRNA synthetase